ncbi:MAG: hypothetical protein IJ532_05630 [Alphaproteobacteria bacterium]|nr:hypothetical protein [Alphaproteobacteria bacterium]
MNENNYIFITNEQDIEYFSNIKKRLDEVVIKNNGKQWTFHKSDPDKIWPSDPHGDSKYEKLNPYDGTIWDKSTKQCIGQLSKRQLIRLQNELKSHKDFSHISFD